MTIPIESKKIELIQWLSTIEDDAILDKVIAIRENEVSGWWIKVSQSERDSIAKGIEDADKGNLKPHTEARKIYEKWL